MSDDLDDAWALPIRHAATVLLVVVAFWAAAFLLALTRYEYGGICPDPRHAGSG